MSAYPARARGLWLVPFVLAEFALRRDRGVLKSRLIRALLGGLRRADVTALTTNFLGRHWTRLFHAQALAALERHRAAGDYLVILSASTDLYVPAIGARLDVDRVVCTELRWQDDGLDGALASANRRGAEKTRCIEALRALHAGATICAYGNARSDLDHLAKVDRGIVVNGSRSTRRRAAALGLATVHWR